MTDEIDRATERTEELISDALAEQARRAGFAGKTAADSAEYCDDCGDAIPAARRAAVPGCLLCVSCQAAHERTHR
ncbi:MAG: TraR/DksA family transcriptional regulator [Burkholderiaceae bacterium]|nr:TraR/DksA family transcriptional regulator [Burkholderiaceae bacterium]